MRLSTHGGEDGLVVFAAGDEVLAEFHEVGGALLVAHGDELAHVVGAETLQGFVAHFHAETCLFLLLQDVPHVQGAVGACCEEN